MLRQEIVQYFNSGQHVEFSANRIATQRWLMIETKSNETWSQDSWKMLPKRGNQTRCEEMLLLVATKKYASHNWEGVDLNQTKIIPVPYIHGQRRGPHWRSSSNWISFVTLIGLNHVPSGTRAEWETSFLLLPDLAKVTFQFSEKYNFRSCTTVRARQFTSARRTRERWTERERKRECEGNLLACLKVTKS